MYFEFFWRSWNFNEQGVDESFLGELQLILDLFDKCDYFKANNYINQ